jgi:hypothetical protein
MKHKFPEVWYLLKEPAVLTAAQIFTNVIAMVAGILTLTGSIPYIASTANTAGPIFGVVLGSILTLGGALGTVTVLTGTWWLERVALLITGLGWVLLMPVTIAFALAPGGSAARWLIFLMLLTSVLDIFKRYRRIDWAYLDPTKGTSHRADT